MPLAARAHSAYRPATGDGELLSSTFCPLQRLDSRVKDLASQLDAARSEHRDLKEAAQVSRNDVDTFEQLTREAKAQQIAMAGASPVLR